jgi:aryl-alcohol dehydrogenase-like predicted oxidoreductase
MAPVTVATRPCGASGLDLPVLGLGCWAFGGGQYWGPQSQPDVDAVVHRALDVGVTYFDTAEGYNAGASEVALGQALDGRRTRAIIGSKISPNHTHPAVLRAHCEASLSRLRTDWIDLYLVHWPINASSMRHFTGDPDVLTRPPSAAEAFDTLAALRREGKIRFVGVSNFGVQQLSEALASAAPIAANELPYNLLMRACEQELLPACARAGVGVLGYMALMQGLLSGRFTSFDSVPAARTRTRHFSPARPGSRHGEPGLEAETAAALQSISEIAAGAGLPVSDLALAWAVANPAIACTIVGCRNEQQLADNLRALTVRLPDHVMAALDHATRALAARLGPSIDYYQGAADSRSF